MTEAVLKKTIEVANGLGECILWDDKHGHVLWTDMPGKRLYDYNESTDFFRSVEFDEDLCSFALVENSDDLLCAFQSGFAIVDRYSGDRQWLQRIDNADKMRLNDGRTDRQGRFWCGSLVDNAGAVPTDGLSGELFRFDHDGTISKHLDGIGVSNSLCWSPDGATMYFGDTLRKEIWQFDVDVEAGTIGNRRPYVKTPEPCGPDGSIVDAEGCVWNAEWGQGRVVRYTPGGKIDTVVQLPTSHVTCLAFGGEKLSDLYVTTARYGLSEERLKGEPQAGNVFVYETQFQGLAENRFVNRVDMTGKQE